MNKRGYRTGAISKETAIKRFNEYYNKRSKSPIARLRAKMFDMMYQKKPKFVLRPGEPGSEKYLLEEGPRTFDMVGVDYFDENEQFTVETEGEYAGHIGTSKGATFKKRHDTVENVTIDSSGREKSPQIYGPRVRDSNELYNSHFKKSYNSRKNIDSQDSASLKDKSLVEKYWELYRSNPKKFKRKNIKNKKKIPNFTFMSYDRDELLTIYEDDLDNVEVEDTIEKIRASDRLYIEKLGIIKNLEEGEVFDQTLAKQRIFKVTIDLDLFDDESEKEEFFLDILTAKLYYIEDCEDTNYILNLYIDNIVVNGDIDNIIRVVPDSGCTSIINESQAEKKSEVAIAEYRLRTPSLINLKIDDLQKIDDSSIKDDTETIHDEYIDNEGLTRQISEISDVGDSMSTSISKTTNIESEERVDSDSITAESSISSRERSLENAESLDLGDEQDEFESKTRSPVKTDESPILEDIDSLVVDESINLEQDDESSDDEIAVVEIILNQDTVIGDTQYNLGDMLYLEEDTNRLIDPNTQDYIGELTSDIVYSRQEEEYVSDNELGGLLEELDYADDEKNQLRNILSTSTDIDPNLASRINL